MSQLNTAT